MKALILEGGAMRTVHSAGALTALSEMGIKHDHFDLVFGASAGACNGAYFVADQSSHFWEMWTKTMLTPDFINLRNAFSRTKPIIDVNFVVEEIMAKHHKIDLDKIISSKTKFYTVVTNCSNGQPEYFLNDKKESFFNIIKASASIPILYNKSVEINGQEYMDGAITDGLPIKKAIEMGATEIYVLLTRHEGYKKTKTLTDAISANICRKYPFIKQAILERYIDYNQSMETIENNKDVDITIIRPKYNLGVTRVTNDPKKIKNAFLIGYKDAVEVLKKKNISFENLPTELRTNNKK